MRYGGHDEDIYEVPGNWRPYVHPRRGGIVPRIAELDLEAPDGLRRWADEQADHLAGVLDAPDGDPELAGAARDHLKGGETPLGAAVVAATAPWTATPRFADAWAASYGLGFAAAAVVELAGIGAGRPDAPVVRLRDDERFDTRHVWKPAVRRARALLAVAEADDHRAAVAALAGLRTSRRRRIIASFLAPTEAAWVDECLAEGPGVERDGNQLWSMLLCSLGSAEQAAALPEGAGIVWTQGFREVLATVAEGVGTAVAPLLAGMVGRGPKHHNTDVLDIVSGVPTDEAFTILLDRLALPGVLPAVQRAMERRPRRALRLLPRAAGAAGPAAQLLAAHIRAHPDLVAEMLPGLPDGDRAVVEGLAGPPIEEAPLDALPRVLADPPWLRASAAPAAAEPEPAVIDGLATPAGHSLVWAGGERAEWAALRTYYGSYELDPRWASSWEEAVETYRAGKMTWYGHEIAIFAQAPEELVRPLLAGWRPRRPRGMADDLKQVVARFEMEARAVAVHAGSRDASGTGAALLPFLDAEVARLMADWLVRLKSARRIAESYFARHGAAAVPLLVPDAFGRRKPPRRAAVAALRLIAERRSPAEVVEAAREHGDEAARAVAALLAVPVREKPVLEETAPGQVSGDPLDRLPDPMPRPGRWADPAALPPVLLRDGRALPVEAAGHLVTMLAISRPGQVYAGVDIVREACDPASLAEFGWALFERWRAAGMPKGTWALDALGRLGDDETVRRLTPLIRVWPGESGHQRAVMGLNVLAEIGTDVALAHLSGIARRVRYKGLRDRARQKTREVADALGLTPEQLADRVVPDLGLSADGTLVLDYGRRRFVVGFDEQLRPYVTDEKGRARRTPPAPGARDDAEPATAARRRFTDLKKEVRTVAADQISRLEAAMVTGRRWSAGEFRRLIAGHPLLWHIARRLVWASDAGEFRMAEDRTLADASDDAVELPDSAEVRIPHPVDLAGSLDAWSEIFADYEILQPFPQLGRPVHALTEAERGGHRLARFEGSTAPTGKVLGLTRHGWERGAPQDGGVEQWISLALPGDRRLIVDLDPGVAVGMTDLFPEQTLRSVALVGGRGHEPLGELRPAVASELLADLIALTT